MKVQKESFFVRLVCMKKCSFLACLLSAIFAVSLSDKANANANLIETLRDHAIVASGIDGNQNSILLTLEKNDVNPVNHTEITELINASGVEEVHVVTETGKPLFFLKDINNITSIKLTKIESQRELNQIRLYGDLVSLSIRAIPPVHKPGNDNSIDYYDEELNLRDIPHELECLRHLSSLEELELTRLVWVKDISPISDLKNLKSLTLGVSSRVTDLSALSNLHNLEELAFAGITSNIEFLRNLSELRKLSIALNFVDDLSPLQNKKKLVELRTGIVKELKNIGSLTSLRELRLASSGSARNLDDLSRLSNLSKLFLGVMEGVEDFSALGNLKGIEELDIEFVGGLKDLSFLQDLPNLNSLRLEALSRLESLDDLTNLNKLEHLKIGQLNKVEEITSIGTLSNLKSLHLWAQYSQLKNLEPLKGLESLTELRLSVRNAESILPLQNLRNLEILLLSTMRVQGDLGALENMSSLKELTLGNLALSNLKGLEKLTALERLELEQLLGIEDITPIGSLSQLKRLTIKELKNVSFIDALSKIRGLETLELGGFNGEIDIAPLANLTSLTTLNIDDVRIKSSALLGSMPSLTEAHLSSLDSTDHLLQLSNLRKLTVTGRFKDKDLSALKNLVELRELSLRSFSDVADISAIGNLTKLRKLSLTGFENVQSLREIKSLPMLTDLTLTGFNNVKDSEVIGELQNLKLLNLTRLRTQFSLDVFQRLPKLNTVYLAQSHINTNSRIDLEKLGDLQASVLGSSVKSLSEMRERLIHFPHRIPYLEMTRILEMVYLVGARKQECNILSEEELQEYATYSNIIVPFFKLIRGQQQLSIVERKRIPPGDCSEEAQIEVREYLKELKAMSFRIAGNNFIGAENRQLIRHEDMAEVFKANRNNNICGILENKAATNFAEDFETLTIEYRTTFGEVVYRTLNWYTDDGKIYEHDAFCNDNSVKEVVTSGAALAHGIAGQYR